MDLEKAVAAFIRNGYAVTVFEKAEDAAKYLYDNLNGRSIGFGDSETLLSLKLFEKLSLHNTVFDPMHCAPGKTFNDTAKECLTTEIFLTSVNAMSETGELVNIDGTGNRIAGSLFGHRKVYFVAGTHKLVPTLEEAIWRARNIAAPRNARRWRSKTPCAEKGERCFDCSSPDRICNGMIIHWKKMSDMEMEIVLIKEELGF